MSAGDEDLEVLAGSGVGDGRRPDGGGSGAENGQGDEDGDAAKAAASSIAWLHCSVGPKMEEGETEDGLKQQVRSCSRRCVIGDLNDGEDANLWIYPHRLFIINNIVCGCCILF